MLTTIDTTTSSAPFMQGHGAITCGSRKYVIFADGTDLVYFYSDNGGDSWNGPTSIAVVGSVAAKPDACYDAVNDRLNICWGGGNSSSAAMGFRAIASASTGTPSFAGAAQTIDAGGANLGVDYPMICHSATGSNPRYWIFAFKVTAASTYEVRGWYVPEGTTADTAANWVQHVNFRDVFGNSSSNSAKGCTCAFWTDSGGNPLVTCAAFGTSGVNMRSVTFDPTVTTPAPPAATAFGVTPTTVDIFANGPLIWSVPVDNNYIVGYTDTAGSGTCYLYITPDGTTWTQITNFTGGRMSLGAKAQGDVYCYYTDTYIVIGSSTTMSYRKLSPPYTTIEPGRTFGAAAGNEISIPVDLDDKHDVCLYRGSVASPYNINVEDIDFDINNPVVPHKPNFIYLRKNR